jgi:Tol biopolymer transport system component
MNRLIAPLLIAACSLPLLAGCGTATGMAPVQRVSRVTPKVATPAATKSTGATAGARGFYTQTGAASPSFSPKGDQLIAETPQGLAFMLPSGQSVRLVAGTTAEDHAPSFSPDGASVLFIRHNGTRSTALMRLTVGTGLIAPIWETPELIQAAAWSADGRALVYAADTGTQSTLYRLSVPGNAPQALWRGTGVKAVSVSAANVVAFDHDLAPGNPGILKLSLNGGNPAALSLPGTHPHHPRFSPSGKSLAYAADEGLYVVSAEGSGALKVAGIDGVAGSAWNPAGSTVVVASTHGARTDLQAVELPKR